MFIYQSRSILKVEKVPSAMSKISHVAATYHYLKKMARTDFSKGLTGKNIALLIMIDYDKCMIVVPRR